MNYKDLKIAIDTAIGSDTTLWVNWNAVYGYKCFNNNNTQNNMDSIIDKKIGAIQSQVDKKLADFESKLKSLKEEVDKMDDQIDFLENTAKFLQDELGYKVYKVKNDTHTSTYDFYALPRLYVSSGWDSECQTENITIEKLQTLGRYTIFSAGENTYAIAKKLEAKAAKKLGRPRKNKRGRPKTK